jgi:GNAT superfamily N-acetyltransferase
MPYELRHGDYLITDDPSRLDLDVIHAYLSRESYWAADIPRDIVERSLQNSLCLGAYAPGSPSAGAPAKAGAQVGLARLVTDYATYAWLCDVFVIESHRRHGLGKALIQAVVSHPRLQNLRRLALATRDAHGLYAQFGFTPLATPQTHMERRNQNIYRHLRTTTP